MTHKETGPLIDEINLDSFGENIANGVEATSYVSAASVSRELMAQLRLIREVHDHFQRQSFGEGPIPEAVEWLLDNWYLAQREGILAAQDIKSAGRVRCAKNKEPLLMLLCSALVRSGGGEINKKRCEIFLSGFQRSVVLSRQELALFIPCVKASLIRELARLCHRLGRRGPSQELGARMDKAFSSLRLLGSLDLSDTMERVDKTEQILRQDPAGIYSQMDEKTRDHYRKQVSWLARRLNISEHIIAQRVLRLSEGSAGEERHVGHFLFTAPLGEPARKRGGSGYIALNVLLSLFLSLLAGFLTDSVMACFLLLVPLFELVKNLTDFIALRIWPPRHVPRMELRGGVPDEGRTLCVISALITGGESGAAYARLLEEYRLSNRDAGKNLLFGILADLPESDKPEIPDSEQWIQKAAEAIEGLNAKYGGGFYLLFRQPKLNEADGKYMGWERKRGAIWELARLLRGSPTGLQCLSGDQGALSGTRYILTLDSDTRLCPGTARELIGAMLHPLNAPRTDKKRKIVTGGTAVIHPRMAVELHSVGKSDFSHFFAGQGGTDPYGSASGEVYMDLFDSGGFAGKGIIHIGAFLECLEGRIAENTVLSHDMIEGAYLRGYYMGDVELTDCYPSKVLSYHHRMDRWTRGDWQNAPWLFKRGRELRDIDRWKTFDNLRRSLTPPMTFIAILAGFLVPRGGLVLAAAAAFLCMASRLLLTVAETAFKRDSETKVKYHSTIVHGVGGGLIQTVVRLILLPYEAWVCARAIILALWRMLVSRKNLLSWQTAAQSDVKSGGVLEHYKNMWFVLPAGLVALIFSRAIIGSAAGVIWLLGPLYAMAISRDRKGARAPGREDREYLTQCAREIWRFFEMYITPLDNHLPVDNWQEQPPVGLAHRTSPTNIGLCLLSALAALDLGIATEGRAMVLIENLLTTMERMPKWKGHLYNWYNTRTLQSLNPKYVSTVDSGNLAGSLIVLRQGLAEYGRDDLAQRADELLRPMDFAALYDESRRLFYIGRDIDKDEPTKGWYDLLASEARLAGYVAIAKGDVERRHWRRLSRAQVSKDGYRGMASWTGTMFEYLMPELFMPCYKDSLLYESARFCLYVQKRRVPSRLPWGISESAFFSLDPSLSYRYKAHGCAALALKRGMDKELVVSPYSSFLALAVEPRGVVKNLKKLEALGARGRFGFWEAVDFTPSRMTDGSHEVARCVMSHHIGMSLVSIANYLREDCMPRRFMSDPSMAAHAGLLQERVPIGGVLLHRRERELPEKPARAGGELWQKQGEDIDFLLPECCLLSNGAYHLLLTESGLTRSQAGNILIYRPPVRQIGDGVGMGIHLYSEGGLTSLLPLPEIHKDMDYSWDFSSGVGTMNAQGRGFRSKTELCVSSKEQGELRRVSITNTGDKELRGEVVLTFEPVLARQTDYQNHPAFYKLGLKAYSREGSLLVQRIKRGSLGECFLCLACDGEITVSSSRERLPGRGGLAAALGEEPEGSLGWLADPLLCVRAPVAVRPGETAKLRFSLCLAATEKEAYRGAQQMLAMGEGDRAFLPRACAALLDMDASQVDSAMAMAKHLVFPSPERGAAGEHIPHSHSGREGLWRFGISGDLPIVCARLTCPEEHQAADILIKRHALLGICGLFFDLVFITDDGGDYRRPRSTALWESLRKLGRECFAGVKGGIHFADSSMDTSCLYASASVNADLRELDGKSRRETGRDFLLPAPSGHPLQQMPKYKWDEKGRFSFIVSASLPPRSWSNMLTNGSFGYIASDSGTGHMWRENARECRINRWLNDPLATLGSETLEAVTSSGRHSLFAAPDDEHCLVTFDFGSAVWEKRIGGLHLKTTAFVPMDTDARVFIIEARGDERARIAWFTELVLSSDDKDAAQVITSHTDGVFRATNIRCPFPDTEFSVLSSHPPQGFTCNRFAWLQGKLDGESGAGFDPCIGALYPAEETLVIVCGSDREEKLRALTDPGAARAALEETLARWRELTMRLTVETPDEGLNHMLNGWAVYQAVACRILGRTSVYQSGGAYGFRDQLQDMCNMAPLLPRAARRHIIDCCARQFEEGDVQHWWHPQPGMSKGVRTRCSDDLLWLPWALCEYVDQTGDMSICDEKAPYLHSRPLAENEMERYETPQLSPRSDTVLEHARRAIELVIERGGGAHGLLLMGGGDWNDGMDKVGAQGRGESVWLSWFFAETASRFSELLAARGDVKNAARVEKSAVKYGRAANDAWDGDWYLRGYFDDGAALGSKSSECCRIDSVAQSFAAFSRHADFDRCRASLNSAIEKLFDRENAIIRLFDPPFENSSHNPGYIESYGPGFRENGGQYTHGAIWLSLACFVKGMARQGYEILRAVMPASRDIQVYGAEPFVIPADVYTAPGNVGRSGWTWYTGSAGWFYRVAVQNLLGLKLREGKLYIDPRLPEDWPGYSARWRTRQGREYHIRVEKGDIFVNDRPYSGEGLDILSPGQWEKESGSDLLF